MRSVGAVAAGFLVIVILSIATDQLFHSLGVYGPWGEPMLDPAHNMLALAYRIVYSVLGCYVAAWLAPRKPMVHALSLGLVGVFLSAAGAAAMWEMALPWYSVALVLVALPSAWLGGHIRERQLQEGR